ncbi:MAG TPA: hypothetical protein VM674_07790 [Candidatus Acidoferrum sp.]|nr:hypothetical protein [Candidatus Acidoferrum sp.]
MSSGISTAIPETRYALNGDVHLAYQTLGEGPPDLLSVISGPGSHESPPSQARAKFWCRAPSKT